MKTVVGVPVPFTTVDEVTAAIAGATSNGSSHGASGYLLAGDLIVEDATGEVLDLDIYEHDDALRFAFERAAPYSSLTDADLSLIHI